MKDEELRTKSALAANDSEPLDLSKPPSILSALWYELVKCLGWAAMTLGSSFRAEGQRHIPRQGPALLVANHQSFLDPLLVGMVAPRHLHYLARKTLFRNPFFAGLIHSLNAVSIDQEGVGKEGIRTVVELLRQGHATVVFPEGERTPDGGLQALRPGVHLLLKRTQAPVVPVGIAGAFDAWPRHRPLPLPAPLFLPATRGTIAVAVGRPLDATRLARLPRDQALHEMYRAIQKMWQHAEKLRRK